MHSKHLINTKDPNEQEGLLKGRSLSLGCLVVHAINKKFKKI